MPRPLDLALVLLFALLWPLWNLFVQWPAHVRAVSRGEPDARRRLYQSTLWEQWLLTGAAISLTLYFARPATTLGLGLPTGWRWLGFALPVAYATLASAQLRALAKKPDSLAKLRTTLTELRPLVPHTAREWAWFKPVSVTAGICEEVLFRGYLVWVLTPWLGGFGAAALSVAVFGAAHAYQGRSFAIRATLAGLVMGALALVCGSVLPGIALHAVVDLVGGYAGYLALRGETA